MKYNILETLVGFLVIAVAVVFVLFAYRSSSAYNTRGGYAVWANFQNIDGISVGSDVMLAGIKIGSVEKLALDPDTFVAKVTLHLQDGISLPKDSQAAITTSGLLGGKFIGIVPGADEDNIRPGEQIKRTQSSVSLENLIGKMIYSK